MEPSALPTPIARVRDIHALRQHLLAKTVRNETFHEQAYHA
jgi:hypothetical protein